MIQGQWLDNLDIYPQVVITLAIILGLGTILGGLAKRRGLPAATGYFISGVLLGPDIFNILVGDRYNWFEPIAQFALGVIVFEVGMELWFKKIRRKENHIFSFAAFQSFFTFALVSIIFFFIFGEWTAALLIGAIAATTSPVPIYYNSARHKEKENKVFRKIAAPIVGIDDTITLILFSIVLALAAGWNTGISNIQHIQEAIVDVIGAVAVGILIGLAIAATQKIKKSYESMLLFTIIAVLLGMFSAQIFEFPLLITMLAAGTTFTNTLDKTEYKMHDGAVSKFLPPITIAFFAVIGSAIEISALLSHWWYAVIYLVVRTAGKYISVTLMAKRYKMPCGIVKNLWIAMIPQGGFAIGLALIAIDAVGQNSVFYMDALPTLLVSIFILEIIGAQLVDFAFKKNVRDERSCSCCPKVTKTCDPSFRSK